MLSRLVSLCSDWIGGHSTGGETATGTGGQNGEATVGAETDGGIVEESADEASLVPNASSNGTTGERTDSPATWQDLLSGEAVSKQEVQVELGLQPHEFLAWLVRSSGGRMWQADMVDTTGWSKSTVSRYLDTLESNGVVERVRIGRRKLVGVPGRMPDAVPPSGDPPDGSPADARSREVDGPA